MANVDRPRGFRPAKYASGAPWTGKVERFVALSGASAIFVGDLVELNGDADVDGNPAVRPLQNIVSGPTVGAVVSVGFLPTDLNTGSPGSFAPSAATINRYVYVASDPQIIFEVQADSAMDFNDVGYYSDVTVSQYGSATTGTSGMELDASVLIVATTSSDHLLRIVGFSTQVDNEVSNDSSKVLVMLNPAKHSRGTGVV